MTWSKAYGRSLRYGVLVAACVPGVLGAQARVTLGGTVFADDGRRLADVEVQAGDGRWQARTDSLGVWQVHGVSPGRYRVRFRHFGFIPRYREVEVTAARPAVRLADTLHHTAARLEAVVVSARRAALPGTFDRAERGISVVAYAEDIAAIRTNLFDIDALIERSARLRPMSAFTRGSPPYCKAVRDRMVFVDGRQLPAHMAVREWVGPYELEAFEITRGPAAMAEERRRRAAGDTTGPRLDPRIGACTWVWLFWTKDYARGRRMQP